MRYSAEKRATVVPEHDTTSSLALVKAVTAAVPKAEHRVGSILLVGGSDFRSVAVRRAQAPLRFDLQSSYWSHAALLTEWPSDDPSKITGREVTLEPDEGTTHHPGENGVTSFRLSRYMDETAYPNLCIVVPSTGGPDVEAGWRAAIVEAAERPNSGRPQYALYQWLAEWARYAMIAPLVQNPLLANVPLPCASFVDYAYSAARMNLLPSATTSTTAPEHLWSTFTHWTEAMRSRLVLSTHRRVMNRSCPDAVGPAAAARGIQSR